MKRFPCPKCRQPALFEHERCSRCGTELAFDPGELRMLALGDTVPCANRTLITCNWARDEDNTFCASCRLTRTIPNLGSQRNVILWRKVEEAKRRLAYDLRRLALPLAATSGSSLAFDILSEETAGHPIMTGHSAGLITLNLVEADDAERESRRIAMRETYRTLLGHLRHEVGHFYWDLLIARTSLSMPFRAIFGDESVDYQTALNSYHNRADRSFDRVGFISEYATLHPWEDWAETFAHFLHIVSTLDSAGSLPLLLNDRARQTLQDPYREEDFDALLASWAPIAEALNELNRSVGQGDAYPFELSPIVNGKLHFVHMAIASYRETMRRQSRASVTQ
jgi:hypothetical protein